MKKSKIEFNFWPSFTDIMVATILILLFVFIFITSGVVKSLYFRDYQRGFVYSVAEALDVGGSSFSVRVFSGNQAPEGLYKRILLEFPEFAHLENGAPVDRLNAILHTINLFEKCASAKKDLRLGPYGQWLLKETETYRQRPFAELIGSQQKNIIRLNRVLLETLYPDDCPKDRSLSSEENTSTQYRTKETIILQVGSNKGSEIVFESDLQLQRITFSEHILFPKDDHLLKPSGKDILLKVGKQIKQNIDRTKEIQILGHADTDRPKKHESNFHLAAKRAIEVLRFFNDHVGIDPKKYVMSATSYGEFKPTCRTDESPVPYPPGEIEKCNNNEEKKAKNRRIELLIRYRMDKQSTGSSQ